MRTWMILSVLWFTFFLTHCTPSVLRPHRAKQISQLKEQIHYLLDDPTLKNAHIGLYVASLKDDQILYAQNAFKLMIPASNMKLFTTATALVKLGPEFRFKTTVAYSGSIEDSTLLGDLVIKGSGDPSFSGRFYEGDRLAVFKQWADSLKAKGIKNIAGRLIGDEHFFKDPKLGEGWNWDDEPFWYSAKISALAFNDNCVDVAVIPDSLAGNPVHVTLWPAYEKMEILNRATTVDSPGVSELNISRLEGRNIMVVEGRLSRDADTLWESITVENPGQFFLDVLQQTLKDQGITISTPPCLLSSKERLPADSLKPLFTFLSPPLSELIKVVNKPSHNFYAEQLLKTLGGLFKNEGSFEAGAQVVREFLNSIGIADEHFLNVDGSGLSRKNFVAPIATATLLRYMYHHPYFKYFLDSLPIAGVDGTLKNRMVGTPAQGRVFAKTGYVRHMRALSGYTGLDGGNPLLFVMMFNNYSVPTAKVNLIQDRIAVLLSSLH